MEWHKIINFDKILLDIFLISPYLDRKYQKYMDPKVQVSIDKAHRAYNSVRTIVGTCDVGNGVKK